MSKASTTETPLVNVHCDLCENLVEVHRIDAYESTLCIRCTNVRARDPELFDFVASVARAQAEGAANATMGSHVSGYNHESNPDESMS